VPVHWVTGFVADGLLVATGGEGHAELPDFSWAMAGISTAAAVGGAIAGLAVYGLRRDRAREPLRVLGPLHTLLSQKYYVDALYEGLIVRRSFYRVVAALANWIDRRIVDGIVDLVGWFFRNIGSAVARLQTGQVQGYATAVALGSLLIILGFLLAS
jgi:NADH-quinone oxidoreductase subunit L